MRDKSKRIKDKKIRRGFLSFIFYPLSSRQGFTLLEIVISLAIIAFIGALSLVSFVNSRRVRDLAVAGQNTLSVLQTARTNASAGQDASQWGVHLEQYRMVLFRGATYAGATAATPYPLPPTIEIVNTPLAGTDFVFKRLNGSTDTAGAFTVRVRGSATQTFPITVDASGAAYRTGAAPVLAGTRIIDARHRNFALGWSVQNAITMRLTFSDPPNPDDPRDIAMSPAAPRTAFDWSGIFTIGGQNQTLRIHAIGAVSSGPTMLSVDRDCRKNTKKVKIAIDGKDIATYEANCTTVTAGPFGGTMTEP